MRFGRQAAGRVGDEVDIIPGLHGGERCLGEADFGPEARHDELAPPRGLNSGDEARIGPGIGDVPVNGLNIREHAGDAREERIAQGAAFGIDRGEDGGDRQGCGGLREARDIVGERLGRDRLDRESDPGLMVDQAENGILDGEFIDVHALLPRCWREFITYFS